jgi:hypothetical protein
MATSYFDLADPTFDVTSETVHRTRDERWWVETSYGWAVLDYEVVIREFDPDEWVRGLAIPDERRIELFDQRMAEVVNHYVLQAIGNQIDLSDQLEYILTELEANKQAILEDIKSGT